jgi:hypothetical protein
MSVWTDLRLHSERRRRLYRHYRGLKLRIVPSWIDYVSTSWGLWTSETTTSVALVSAEAKGALGREGVLVPAGVQAQEVA